MTRFCSSNTLQRFSTLVWVSILPLLSSCAGPGGTGGIGAQGGKQVSPADFITGSVWFFLLGLAVYYILVLKPGFEEEDRQKKFIDELKKNDEVVTAGGVFGRVFSIQPEFITVEIAPNIRIKVVPTKVFPVKSKNAKTETSKSENSNKDSSSAK